MKVLLVEFNELTPHLMKRFMDAGKLPNFSKLHAASQVFTTEAEERDGDLEPWIQWITVHSGLSYREHGMHHLGQGHDLKAKRLWDVATEHGKSVWICGSMNAYPLAPVKGRFMPDPWAAQALPQPDALLPFFRFVQANVQDHKRDGAKLGPREYASFLAFMARHGLSWSTIRTAISQVVGQVLDRTTRWKRAVVLDRLQLDLFRHEYARSTPDLATFFSNSTAHFQHHFWRHMQPELYQHKPSDQDVKHYGDAILFGYQQMDDMLGQISEIVDDDTALVFCTALSQQACLIFEHLGGGMTYRPKDYEAFLRFAGVTSAYTVEQAMASRFGIRFETEDAAREAARLIDALKAGGQKAILQVEQHGTTVFFDCGFHNGPLEDLMLTRGDHDTGGVRFGSLFYAYAQFNGMHNPDGMLWVRMPGKPGKVREEKVPLTAVAPTLLTLLNLPIPEQMKAKPLALVG